MTTLSRAIESIAAKAKKQLDETGSLHGFSASYHNPSGSGVIALSVSAVAADDEDAVLSYTLDMDNSAAAIKDGQDSSAQLIEELMDFLNGLRTAARRKAVAPLRAHA